MPWTNAAATRTAMPFKYIKIKAELKNSTIKIIMIIIITFQRTENVQLPVATVKKPRCFAKWQCYGKTVYINYSINILFHPVQEKKRKTNKLLKNRVHFHMRTFVITDLSGLCTRKFLHRTFPPSKTSLSVSPGRHTMEGRDLAQVLVPCSPSVESGESECYRSQSDDVPPDYAVSTARSINAPCHKQKGEKKKKKMKPAA